MSLPVNKASMKQRYVQAHMKVAYVYANLSYCERRKVGCVIVKDDRIISIGYNGTPTGWDNCCEDSNNNTKPEVIHAEANAIAKLAKIDGGGFGASVFTTSAPCYDCAKQLGVIKIKDLYYCEEYRITDGIDFLERCGIIVYKVTLNA